MNRDTDIRRESRITFTDGYTHFSSQDFREFALNIKAIFQTNENLFDYLTKLATYYCIHKVKNDINDVKYEKIIFESLCQNFTYDMPFFIFEQIAQNLAIILQQQDSFRYFSGILVEFFPNLIKMLYHSPVSAYTKCVIKLITIITSKSTKFTKLARKNLPLEFFFEIINSEDASEEHKYYASSILANIMCLDNCFYQFNQFIEYIDVLIQNNKLESLPKILFCIGKMLVHYHQIEYHQMFISNYRIEYLNSLLGSSNDYTLKNVLLIFSKLVTNRLSLNEIDILKLFEMFSRDNVIATYSAQIVASFLQKCPESADVLCSLNIIQHVTEILHNGSCETKKQALNIIFSLFCSASPENKSILIQAPILHPLLELATGMSECVIELIFSVLQMMIDVAAQFNLSEPLKNQFLAPENDEILESLAGGEGRSAQLAVFLLNALNTATE